MTITNLQKEVTKALRKANCRVMCPVSINNRLTKTLGRAMFTRQGGRWVSVRIEFSGKLIQYATEKTIMDVLLHEGAHVVANYRTGCDQGHNHIFKAVCHELGTSNDGYATTVEYKDGAKPVYKFEVVCPNCGVVATYNRSGKVVQNIWRYSCGKCHSHNLKVLQSW